MLDKKGQKVYNQTMTTDKLYKLPEAAKLLNVHARTLKRWHEQGKIVLVTLPGGHFRVPESEVRRLMGIEQDQKPELQGV